MISSKVIVTGGCGYIGSHTIVDLQKHGFEVVCIDNNSRSDAGMLDSVMKITGKQVLHLAFDLAERERTLEALEEHADALGIIHFAAFKSVPESVEQPLLYFRNNMDSLFNLLEGTERFGIPNFVFSSSCSVYGNASELPVAENTPWQAAQSPYGRTKQMGEEVIRDCSKAMQAKFVMLRYFNPVGAHPSAEIGETPIDVPNNLVPYITQTAIGKLKALTVYGNDYPTRDGTCIRDYIHVMDIAHAHTLALQYLLEGKQQIACDVFNLGTGKGVSVLEAIQAFERVSGKSLPYHFGERRPGDVVAVYANNEKARRALGWETQYTLDDMMASAWKWEQRMAE
jgi:UDP-glucose 4-epimerase